MARISKVEACMFCEQVPCQCNAKPKAERKPRTPKAKADKPTHVAAPVEPKKEFDPTPSRKPGPFASMGFVDPSVALASGAAAERVEQVKTQAVEQAERKKIDDAPMAAAMRALLDARILHPSEASRAERLAGRVPPAELRQSVREWRKRNA